MRVLLSLAAVLLPAIASAGGPPSCPEGFEAVSLGRGGGTGAVTITEDLLTRGVICEPKPFGSAPAAPRPWSSGSDAWKPPETPKPQVHAYAPFPAKPLPLNPPRPAPLGVATRFVARTYDDFDRISSETVPLEDGGTATIQYTYWPDDRRKTMTDAFGRVTYYEYDGRARLSRVTTNQGLPDERVTTYEYWPDSLLKTITKPNGVVTSYDYDGADRVTTVDVRSGETLLLSYRYTYDRNGNRLSQVETNGGPPETTTYTYDNLNRLETVTYPDGISALYEYDPVGNRTREVTRNAAGTVVSDQRAVFDAINRLSSITDSVDPSNNATLAYDRNGNLVSKTTAAGTESFSYDTRDLLVATDNGGSVTARFAYDAFGRRYLKVADGVRQYLYDETSTLHELDGDDLEVATYEYGGDRLLSLLHRGEPRRYYEHDALGTPVALTDAAGAVVARYHLDAWGRYRFPTELDASANRFGFTGYLFDEETSLYYAKARFYDPELGRFMTQDSVLGEVAEPPSLNRYAYAWARPTVLIDPTGHIAVLKQLQSWIDRGSQELIDAVPDFSSAIARVTGVKNRFVDQKLAEAAGTLAGVGRVASGGVGVINLGANLLFARTPDMDLGQQAMEELGETWQGIRGAAFSIVEGPDAVARKLIAAATPTVRSAVAGDPRAMAEVSALGTELALAAALGYSGGAPAATGVERTAESAIRPLVRARQLAPLSDAVELPRLPAAPFRSPQAPVSADEWVQLFRTQYGEAAVEWSSLRTAPYGEMTDALTGTGIQANHLNQNAAFRGIIPESEGLAVALRGNAFTQPGTEHYLFHSSLERFWSAFRPGGAQYLSRPTLFEYQAAVTRAMGEAGFSPAASAEFAARAAKQAEAAGLSPSSPVPRIPGRLPQKR